MAKVIKKKKLKFDSFLTDTIIIYLEPTKVQQQQQQQTQAQAAAAVTPPGNTTRQENVKEYNDLMTWMDNEFWEQADE